MPKNYILLFLIAIIFFITSCSDIKSLDTNSVTAKNSTPKQNNLINLDKYGVDTLQFNFTQNIITQNQTFSNLLDTFNISLQHIFNVTRKIKSDFDIRKIKVGNRYRVYYDSLKTPICFIYEEDPINYFILHLKDSVFVQHGQYKVETIEKTATGLITNSLYQTLDEKNISPQLAIELSEVFAWQIDFYRIMKNDYFKVLYEEKFVDGKSVGIGNIKAAMFNHMGKDYYAIPFEQDGERKFFELDGSSLRKQFLKTPLKFSRISSRFSYSRFHPILKRRIPHTGIDFAAAVGTPVRAVGDGIVIKARYEGAAGRYVKIRHNGSYMSGYMHLSRFGKNIRVGKKVKQGQIIGYVGSSGRSTGPHLDFRFWINGVPKNYLKLKFPPTHPIANNLKMAFNKVASNWKNIFTKINILDKQFSKIEIAKK